MRKILLPVPLAFASMMLVGALASAASAESPEQIKQEIMKLEDIQSQAMLKGDVDTLGRIYADGIDWSSRMESS
jgi:hypothetical protein